MNKKYLVTKKGKILDKYDYRFNDGAYYCIDYQGEITGELSFWDKEGFPCDTLSQAVAKSKKIRKDIAKEEYLAKLKEIDEIK